MDWLQISDFRIFRGKYLISNSLLGGLSRIATLIFTLFVRFSQVLFLNHISRQKGLNSIGNLESFGVLRLRLA
jgi:hypothetical protein